MDERQAGLFLDRAMQQSAQGQHEAAIETLRRVLGEDPQHARAHALMALCLHAAGRLHAARAEADAATALAPDDPLALMAQGLVLSARRKFEAAEQAYRLALNEWPDHASLLQLYAAMQETRGYNYEALKLLERARDAHPDDAGVWSALSGWHLRHGRAAEAADCAERALRIAPEHAAANVQMGFALLSKGKVDDARAHAVIALRANPRDKSALRLIVACRARSNLLLALWMRWVVWMSTLGSSGQIRVLVGLYLASRALAYALEDLGHPRTAEVVGWAWLAFVVYSWVGPTWFAWILRRETRAVSFKAGY